MAVLLSDQRRRIAVLVARSRRKMTLSPFFAKCDGLLIIDSDASAKEFQENTERTSACMCDLILASAVTQLVCGFIPEPDRDRLFASGVDIRIGSCARPVEALIRQFDALPVA
jgi:predicted Fe-Mo cluster-binding NifX family protein